MTEMAVVKVEQAPPAPLEEQVRVRAYELFLARNCEPGHAEEDWLRAESELAAKAADDKQ